MADDRTKPSLGPHLLERPGMRIVDLSVVIYQGMPIFPAHQRPFVLVNQTHDGWRERYGTEAGFEAHNWIMSEHTGTHTDAVLEYAEDGASVEEMPLAYFYGEAVCLDVSDVRYPEWITPEVLERSLAASGEEIREGDIVLLYTGHGERTFPSDAYLTDQAGLSREGAEWLAKRGVVNIGIDAVAIDHSDDDKFSGHMVCAEYRISNTENLTNLDQLAGTRFIYLGLPIPFRKGTGSPVRAVAWLADGDG